MNSIQDVAMLILGLAVVAIAATLFANGIGGKSVKQSLIDLSGNVLSVEGWDIQVGNDSGNNNGNNN